MLQRGGGGFRFLFSILYLFFVFQKQRCCERCGMIYTRRCKTGLRMGIEPCAVKRDI